MEMMFAGIVAERQSAGRRTGQTRVGNFLIYCVWRIFVVLDRGANYFEVRQIDS